MTKQQHYRLPSHAGKAELVKERFHFVAEVRTASGGCDRRAIGKYSTCLNTTELSEKFGDQRAVASVTTISMAWLADSGGQLALDPAPTSGCGANDTLRAVSGRMLRQTSLRTRRRYADQPLFMEIQEGSAGQECAQAEGQSLQRTTDLERYLKYCHFRCFLQPYSCRL
jgi:hypothetical protein